MQIATNDVTAEDAAIRAWSLRECAHWQARRLRFSLAAEEFRRRVETNPMSFLFIIRDGKVSIADKEPATADRVPIWRPPLYLRFLNDVVSRFCPDLETELLINVGDGGVNRDHIPVFVFQKPGGSNALLLPDVDFLEFEFYENKPQFVDDLPYEAKSCAAIFVGSATGGRLTREDVVGRTLPRLRSALYFKGDPKVDFLLPVLPQAIADDAKQEMQRLGFGGNERVTYKEQFERKFIISMDGWGATCSRLPITLRSNSVLLKYDSPHRLFYFDGFIPWQHYIPITNDDDINDIIRVEESNPGTYAAIARQGRAFADTYLTRVAAMKYTARLLRTYASSFAPDRSNYVTVPSLLPPAVDVMVHVANRGDVWCIGGDWAGGGGLDHCVEGFVVRIGAGIDASDIGYQSVGTDGALSPVSLGGEYCGTRGKRKPLHGLAMRTTGVLAERWAWEYSGRFTDGSEVGPVRQGEVCQAESGAPLSAVRVRLVPAEPAAVPALERGLASAGS